MNNEIQIKDFSDRRMMEEARRILSDGFTLHADQDFTMSELVDYCRRFGSTDDDMLGYMQFNPKDNPDISIVSPDPVNKDCTPLASDINVLGFTSNCPKAFS